MADADTIIDTPAEQLDLYELLEKLGTARRDYEYHAYHAEQADKRVRGLEAALGARLANEAFPVMLRLCGRAHLVTRLADGIDITPLNELR